MKKLAYLIGGLFLALVLGISSASAATVSPPLIELDANRGDLLANTIKLKNDSTAAETYYLSVQAFRAVGEEGQPTFIEDPTGATEWVSFAFDQITLQADQTVAIPFNVQVPQSAPAGGHYVAVFASTQAPEAQGTAVGVASRIGSLILIRVEGNTTESARIAEFSSDKDSYSGLPVDYTVRVENNGNVHVKPVGEIVVRGMFGSEATRLAVNEEGGNVLPNSIRKFSTQWGQDADPNAGFFETYAKQKQEKLFGKYTAELTLVYGEAGKIAKSQIEFWVMPWERIIVDLILLIIAIAVIVYIIKWYNKWLISRYEKSSKGPKQSK